MPKGVMLNHHNLLCRSAGSAQMNGFSSLDVTLNWMPLDHVAGIIYFHLRDVYLGCQQIHGPTELVLQDPLKWLDWIDRYRVSITFAPNFAYGLVNDQAVEVGRRGWDLSSMRYVLNGAEAIVAKTARRFLDLLRPYGLAPSAMRPAWGMSETSSGVTYSDSFSLDLVKDDDAFV
jgi:acyl-CoA synthetase (AMP-forming)/AMP-acid ligase II